MTTRALPRVVAPLFSPTALLPIGSGGGTRPRPRPLGRTRIRSLYYPGMSDARLGRLLRYIVGQHDPTIHEVIAGVDVGRGDLAVAAMR